MNNSIFSQFLNTETQLLKNDDKRYNAIQTLPLYQEALKYNFKISARIQILLSVDPCTRY